MEYVIKYILDKNDSPAWQRINQILGLVNMSKGISGSESAKSFGNWANGLWNKFNTGGNNGNIK